MPDFQGEYEFPIYIIFCGLYRVKSLCKVIICILEYPAIVSNVKKSIDLYSQSCYKLSLNDDKIFPCRELNPGLLGESQIS